MHSRDRRLARLAAHALDAAAEEDRHHAEVRAALVDAVRQSLTALGIDPATVAAIRRLEQAAKKP